MPSLIEIYQRIIDFTMFLRQRNFMSQNVVGDLKMANGTFEFLEMIGDVFSGCEFVPEKCTQQSAGDGILLVSN